MNGIYGIDYSAVFDGSDALLTSYPQFALWATNMSSASPTEALRMIERPKRVLWKIIVGGVIVLVMANNLPLYMGGSTQANAGLAMSALAIFGGLYLIYRGLYPPSI